jgi:hypothetical protein
MVDKCCKTCFANQSLIGFEIGHPVAKRFPCVVWKQLSIGTVKSFLWAKSHKIIFGIVVCLPLPPFMLFLEVFQSQSCLASFRFIWRRAWMPWTGFAGEYQGGLLGLEKLHVLSFKGVANAKLEEPAFLTAPFSGLSFPITILLLAVIRCILITLIIQEGMVGGWSVSAAIILFVILVLHVIVVFID